MKSVRMQAHDSDQHTSKKQQSQIFDRKCENMNVATATLNDITKCEDESISIGLAASLKCFFDTEFSLLKIDASERAIAAKIGGYLQQYFPKFDVDVEHNRMGPHPKRIKVVSDRMDLVYPDIIVHERSTRNNILAIEIKKSSNRESKDEDIAKLKAYKRELGYGYALFIRLGVEEQSGKITEYEWI